MHPEAIMGGNIGKIKTGDILCVDPKAGTVELLGDEGWIERPCAQQPEPSNLSAIGMNMFGPLKSISGTPEVGASFLGSMPS